MNLVCRYLPTQSQQWKTLEQCLEFKVNNKTFIIQFNLVIRSYVQANAYGMRLSHVSEIPTTGEEIVKPATLLSFCNVD